MSLNTVKNLSLRLKWLTFLLILLTPLVILGVLALKGPFGLIQISREVQIYPEMLNWYRSTVVVLISLLTPATYILGYWYIYRLFELYSKGIIYEKANIILIRKAGLVLIAIDIVYMVQTVISGPIFSLLGVTERHITIELKFSMLVAGIFIVLISRIMQMGRELYEQDQLTI